MRKQHQEIIEYISLCFPHYQWIRSRYFGKNKYVTVWDSWFSVHYHDTCVMNYDMRYWLLMLSFWCEDYRTNSTAWMMKDLVEWIFWYKWLPNWAWVKDEYNNKYVFNDNCMIEIEHVPLAKLKLK